MIQIDACKNGDKEALGELYTTYAKRLLGVCRHYVKDDNSAHDILHDAFIIIFMSIQDLKDESKLEGWMITIVRNLSLKYLQNTEKEAIPLSCLNIEIQEAACEEQKKIEFGLLLSAIESLPEGNREVFKLSVLEGLSHKEIGEQLGYHRKYDIILLRNLERIIPKRLIELFYGKYQWTSNKQTTYKKHFKQIKA